MKYGPNGEKHWHEDHQNRNPMSDQIKLWARAFETTLPDLAKAKVEVVNCTPGSALTCFPMGEIEELL